MPRPTQVPHQRDQSVSPTRLSRSSARLSRTIPLRFGFLSNPPGHPRAALQPRFTRFGLFRFRSPLLTESLLISFPALLRWFTSRSLPPPLYFIRTYGARLSTSGLPHSDTRGSPDMCSSPRLFAACHVLLRLSAPLGIHHRPSLRLTILLFRPQVQLSASPAACSLPSACQ